MTAQLSNMVDLSSSLCESLPEGIISIFLWFSYHFPIFTCFFYISSAYVFFLRFGQDNSGFITVENLRQILGETLESEAQAGKANVVIL